jgi:hypothetical protein
MSGVQSQTRVCPNCGSPAGDDESCGGCGLHLALLPELPTRADWEATKRGVSRREDDIAVAAPARVQPVSHAAPSLRPLLHPSERSRLALAVLALVSFVVVVVVVLIGAGAAGVLGQLVGTLLLLTGSIWLSLQVARAHRLGRSLRVNRDTFPQVQNILDNVKEMLDYDRPVDVYVADKEAAPITTINYLGTRIMVLDGGLVGGLLADGKHAQLTFLIGREIGALKARLTRLDVFVVLLNGVNALKVVSPFLLPYYRATTYSGDQIGMVCAGDLAAALEATRRLLVGEKLAASLGPGVVIPQALLVGRKLLPRFAQLFVAEPHVTNRYANLLCFGRYHDPQAWDHLAPRMTGAEASDFENLWQRSPYSRLEAASLGAGRTTG